MHRLTKSQENYLRTIYILARQERAVRVTDVANSFCVAKASASVAVTKLEKKGLVVRDSNRLILLTADGEREARRIYDKFTVINHFLTSKLEIAPNIALLDAGAMEHVVSEETVDALRTFLK